MTKTKWDYSGITWEAGDKVTPTEGMGKGLELTIIEQLPNGMYLCECATDDRYYQYPPHALTERGAN